MKRSTILLAAASAMMGLPIFSGVSYGVPGETSANAKGSTSQKSTAGKSTSGEAKIHRFGTGYIRRRRAPVGKRYRASVRQHQRHAAKKARKAAR